MKKVSQVGLLFFLAFMLVTRNWAIAQTDPIERLWYNEEKSAKIQVYKAGGASTLAKLFG